MKTFPVNLATNNNHGSELAFECPKEHRKAWMMVSG